eukprot:11636090-Alexandrium_andersonii.AAC.1
MNVVGQDGIPAWKKITMQYQPKMANLHLGMLTSLINYNFTSAVNGCLDSLVSWERELQVYEASSVESLSDSAKVAIVVAGVPTSLREALYVAGDSDMRCESVRRRI